MVRAPAPASIAILALAACGPVPAAPGPSGAASTVVRCTLTVDGRLERCSVLESVDAAIDRRVLGWLEAGRLDPATHEGLPVEISALFDVRVRRDDLPAEDR